ncbi:MAG: Cell division ATP-binding protein FtsE [Candidatus Woesebacteria bacterium GW2011_GWA1_39_8]|jgi:cell division transport system ATP-binding protein|uniref:Cell division ATP-binding protein FtsE n=1 Tax=Candidatus Woesebacteria bacterium GW2011_GWA1_39_8 TaxID=1618552 RepID=A0A0G0S2J4_9BACT|nr:MAG: Cell division ATP-binding protein FtsE [Candidatus Woesebacteria bacterium GW2011_GWA1_39_8]
MPAMLRLEHITKTFGDIKALDDVSFSVDEGEFVFLTGPSGAGKTTILRLILREFQPDSGEIFLADKDITKIKNKEIPQLRQQIGVVFQDFKILQEQTVRENVEVALAVKGLSQKDWQSRVNHVLDLVGLFERSELFPSQLSGGELQRVSLARALVVNPKVILADEPTGNLDWETADKIVDLFEKINKEGKTIVMATHHKVIIDKLKKRTINIQDGKLTGEAHAKKEKYTKTKKEENDTKSDTKEEE